MINVDEGSIRLVEGDNKKFKLRESNGTTTTLAYKCDPDRADTICSIFGGNEDEIIKDTISGAVYRNALYGGGGDDLLIGTVKDDTLVGGSGKDTMLGGDSADKFIYNSGDGKDIIYGFDNTDMLEITGNWSASYSSKNNTVAFKVGLTTSAITLKDFTATTFHVNGNEYQIADSKLVRK